jgi:methyltransferase (TIGR00027 family)
MTGSTHIDPDPELARVGATALGIAQARAEESDRPDRLFDDPLAGAFVAGASSGATAFMVPVEGAEPSARNAWAFLRQTVAVRTRFFDEYFTEASRDGCRQVVLLAAGLDARAIRIDWPTGTQVFEVDQPAVLEFKERVLADLGAEPSCRRAVVATDLRGVWARALQAAGFRPGQRTAWLVEGLLPALTHEQSDRLIQELTELSAPGSWLALDHMPQLESMRALLDAIDPSLSLLWKGGPGKSAHDWLNGHGWAAEVFTVSDVASSYRRAQPAGSGSVDGAPTVLLLRARRAGGATDMPSPSKPTFL